MAVANWMKSAVLQASKPKESVIGVLKKNLGGVREGRDRSEVHASDITKPDFCPRKWAFNDLMKVKQTPQFIPLALQTTFDMGCMTAKLLIEEWLGDAAVGNWVCLRCGEQRTMCSKPKGQCSLPGMIKDHIWEYREVVVEDSDLSVTGSLDVLVDVGVAKLLMIELKILAPADFEKIMTAQPEHRLRTALYLRLIAKSNHSYKDRFNLHEARVLYVSRGYGKMNPQWNEILPFKEFEIKRDDASIAQVLQKAKSLKIFRESGKIPSGICATAIDNYAKKCEFCQQCFSGKYPVGVKWEGIKIDAS